VKYIVRSSKKRGRGQYLTSAFTTYGDLFYFYSRKQGRADRFGSHEAASDAADKCWHIADYRVVKLKEKHG